MSTEWIRNALMKFLKMLVPPPILPTCMQKFPHSFWSIQTGFKERLSNLRRKSFLHFLFPDRKKRQSYFYVHIPSEKNPMGGMGFGKGILVREGAPQVVHHPRKLWPSFFVFFAQGRKFMSCSHGQGWVNFLTWLPIGCSLLGSQSGASLLVDTTLDNDYNS